MAHLDPQDPRESLEVQSWAMACLCHEPLEDPRASEESQACLENMVKKANLETVSQEYLAPWDLQGSRGSKVHVDHPV